MIWVVRWIVIISVSMMALLILTLGYIKFRPTKSNEKELFARKRKKKPAVALQKLYDFYYSVPVFKKILINIRLKLEIAGNYGDYNIKRKAAGLMTGLGMIYIVFLTLFWIITKDIVLIILFGFILFFMTATLLEMYTGQIQIKLLTQQIVLMEMIRHKYYETQMIDESFYEASQELDKNQHEIFIQCNRMNDVLISKDIETEVIQYYETAPNKYLKMLLGFAFITKEYGDTHAEGGSVFIKNLSHLGKEVKMELMKLEKLNYALKSMNFITLTPLFLINPVKIWASTNFLPLKEFYETKWGLVLEIVMIGLVFISFIILRKIQAISDLNSETTQSSKWVQKIYKRCHPIVDKMLPPKYSSKWREKEKLIQSSASHESVQQLYTKKIGFMCIGFVLTIMLCLILHQTAIKYELNKMTVPNGFLGGDLNENERSIAMELTESDREIIILTHKTSEKEAIRKALIQKGIVDTTEIEEAVTRILIKVDRIKHQYFKWYELLIAIAIGLIAYKIPEGMHILQRNIRKMDVEDEITAFNSIILMLMHHKRVDIEDVLEWMEMYSRIFKSEFQCCLNSLSKGMDDALLELKEKIAHPQLRKIIDSLILSTEDLSLVEAFDELESDKSYYQELRKEANERITSKKINLGNAIGFVPVYGLVLLYMIVPMVYVSMMEMQHYFTQLQL